MSYLFEETAESKKTILMCPGPVMLSKRVRDAAANTVVSHREPEFSKMLAESRSMLMPIIGLQPDEDDYDAAFITGSGTAANEVVFLNIGPLNRILVVTNGEFGERLAQMATYHSRYTDQLQFAWQEQVDLEKVAAALAEREYALVVMVHHETSTGMLNPVAEVADLAHHYGAMVMVDAISSIGAEEIMARQWGLDIIVGSSGKGLSAMPGIGLLMSKDGVFDRLGVSTKSQYLDVRNHLRYMRHYLQTPNTPAVHVLASLHAALQEVADMEFGRSAKVVQQRASEARLKLAQMELEFDNYGDANSRVVTNVRLPYGLKFEVLAQPLRDRGIVFYDCKGPLKTKSFQIGHIGALDSGDTSFALDQLRQVIHQFQPVLLPTLPFEESVTRIPRRGVTKAVILIAGLGSRLEPLTDSTPKSLLPIGESTVLEHMVTILARYGVTSFVVICGYKKDKMHSYVESRFPLYDFHFVTQHNYERGGNTGFALMLAKQFVQNDAFIKLDGDVIFDEQVIRQLTETESDTATYLCMDRSTPNEENIKVQCTTSGEVHGIGNKLLLELAAGESIGIEKVSRRSSGLLFETLEKRMADPENHKEYYEVSYDLMIQQGEPFRVLDITGARWVEMDTLDDYRLAQRYFNERKLDVA